MSGSDIEIDSDIDQAQTTVIQPSNTNEPSATLVSTAPSTDSITHHNNNTNTNNTTNTDIPPNQTIYINNINDKIKIPQIKKGLYHVFSAYGNIIDIQCHKRIK